MRKALIGLIMAATVLTPVAAEARGGRGDRGGHVRNQNEDDGNRGDRRGGRNSQRQSQAESAPAEQQQAAQPQPQSEPAPQIVERRRGGGGGDDGNRGDRGDRGDRGGRNNQPSIYPQAWQGNPNSPDLRRYQQLEQRNQQRGDRRGDRRDWRNDRRDDRGDWRNDRRGDRRDWDRNWRNDRRYDWRGWRNSNRNIFRGSRYFSPYRNWGYSRFSIGLFLEPLFYGRNYWIGDPWQYRLPPAYPGTQWVRYYNDVVLVDVYSGEVLDVIYDFFW